MKDEQDCFTQSSFFQITLRLLLLLILSLFLPRLGPLELSSPVVSPLVMRRFPPVLSAAVLLCGGDPRYIASSGARSVLSVGTERVRGGIGSVALRVRGGKFVGVVGEIGDDSWGIILMQMALSVSHIRDYICCLSMMNRTCCSRSGVGVGGSDAKRSQSVFTNGWPLWPKVFRIVSLPRSVSLAGLGSSGQPHRKSIIIAVQ